jgi:hypothetical protein
MEEGRRFCLMRGGEASWHVAMTATPLEVSSVSLSAQNIERLSFNAP